MVVGVNRILKYRFPEPITEKLLEMQWWNWDDDKIRESYKLISSPRNLARLTTIKRSIKEEVLLVLLPLYIS